MAQKRMFTMKIIDSDVFLDMPATTQCLYFHLNMRADDDGFIGNPKKIMKITNSSEDDLRLLIAKRFVLTFEDGVIVIKHWRMHNTLSRDRYTETSYTDEKRMLLLKDNGSYSLTGGNSIDDTKLIERSGRQTHHRRIKDATKTHADIDKGLDIDIDKEDINNITVSKDTVSQTDVRRAIEEWNKLQNVGIPPVVRLDMNSQRIRNLRSKLRKYTFEEYLQALENIRNSPFLQGNNNRGWIITLKWFAEKDHIDRILGGDFTPRKKGEQHGKSNNAAAKQATPIIPFEQWDGNDSSDTPFV